MMLLKGSLRSFKRNSLKYWRLLLFFLVIPLWLFLKDFFEIKTIRCFDGNSSCSQAINGSLNHYLGESALTLKQQDLITTVNKVQPLKALKFHFLFHNTLQLAVDSEKKSLLVNFSLVSALPLVNTLDSYKPSLQIASISGNFQHHTFNLWSNGEITPIASSESKITFLSEHKPEKKDLEDLYQLLQVVNKYLTVENVYILGKTVFLSRTQQPDIITSVPFDEESLTEALQSLGFLTTIKEDTSVIDLRYKNPIIR